jgi:hypothetical protein
MGCNNSQPIRPKIRSSIREIPEDTSQFTIVKTFDFGCGRDLVNKIVEIHGVYSASTGRDNIGALFVANHSEINEQVNEFGLDSVRDFLVFINGSPWLKVKNTKDPGKITIKVEIVDPLSLGPYEF